MGARQYTLDENNATLSEWINCYPFMARKPIRWLRGLPITDDCRERYPIICYLIEGKHSLQPDSKPLIVNFAASRTRSHVA